MLYVIAHISIGQLICTMHTKNFTIAARIVCQSIVDIETYAKKK